MDDRKVIDKTAGQIKEQIEFWFQKYFNKTKTEFSGTEQFTFFDLLNENDKNAISGKLELRANEVPVLILKVFEEDIIINTTERFIKLAKPGIHYIDYTDFEWHSGFKLLTATGSPNEKTDSIKTDGKLAEFGIKKKTGEIVYWKIPTGTLGFAFWNVTKKCELIGRKYLKSEK